MISELISNLVQYKSDYDLLMSNYKDLMPQYFYDEAGKAILERAPYKTEQLFKLLNLVNGGAKFPESGLTFDLMIHHLNENKELIESLVEQSKSERKIIGFGGKSGGYKFYPVVRTAIIQIDSSGEFPQSILRGAKLSKGEDE